MYVCVFCVCVCVFVCVWFSLQSLVEAFTVGRGERDFIINEHMSSFKYRLL